MRKAFTMEQLEISVNKFLEFNDYKVFDGFGKISHKKAEEKAFGEYDEFNKIQKIESDFDRELKKLNRNLNEENQVIREIGITADDGKK